MLQRLVRQQNNSYHNNNNNSNNFHDAMQFVSNYVNEYGFYLESTPCKVHVKLSSLRCNEHIQYNIPVVRLPHFCCFSIAVLILSKHI